jgi:pimeloyl-ACP methyl ester carboxylesterase
MAGDDDPIVPLVNARVLARLIPNARLEVFDCGHLFLLTRLERSVATIDAFLKDGAVSADPRATPHAIAID